MSAQTGSPAASLAGDARRVAAAERLVPDTAGVVALNRLSRLAGQLLGTASAQVSLLSDVQTIAGGSGLPPGAVGSRSPLADSLCTVTAAGKRTLVVPQAAADQRVAHLPPVGTGLVGSYLGVPLVLDDGLVVGALCVHDPSPRQWSPTDVAVLEQLAQSAVSELQLASRSTEYESSRAAWHLAIEAAGVGTWEWNLRTGRLTWDDRLMTIFGLDDETFGGTIEAFNAAVHPDDLPRVAAALQEAIDTCGRYEAEFRILRPDGSTRWLGARGQAVGDDTGVIQVLGAAYDTTGHREGEARVARVLETMNAAFFSLDHEWRFAFVNAEAERLLSLSRDQLVGHSVWELFPNAVGSDFETHYRGAVASGEMRSFEAYYPAPLDAWYEVRAWPGPDGLSVYFLDVTARRAQQERAEREARRSTLLAEVGNALLESLDTACTVTRVAQLMAGTVCDWCLITIVDADRPVTLAALHDVGWWHRDPARRDLVGEYAALRTRALTEESWLIKVLQTGRPVRFADGIQQAVAAVLTQGRARDLVGELAPEAGAFLPLRGRTGLVGVMSLFTDHAELDPEDYATALEIADRAGLALDNARLYAQQRDLAESLQRSLLSEPPTLPGLDIQVRYVPAARAAQVGGDWYDVFDHAGGAVSLVIGDVAGHDIVSAAAMGQVRGLLRGIAVTGDGDPVEVLAKLDDAMSALAVDATATATVVRMDRVDRVAGAAPGGPPAPRLLRWANAGHPPPVLARAGRPVELGGASAPDLMLGVRPGVRRVAQSTEVGDGDLVVLYTDGLVERRGRAIDEGLAALCRAVESVRDAPVPEICERLLRALLPEQPDDDVALLVARVGGRPAG